MLPSKQVRRIWLALVGALPLGFVLAWGSPACSTRVVSESSASTGTAPWVDPCCYGGYYAGGGDERTLDGGLDATVQDAGACGVAGLLAEDVCYAVCGYDTTCALVEPDTGTVRCYECAVN
jgi:hypothetical protein